MDGKAKFKEKLKLTIDLSVIKRRLHGTLTNMKFIGSWRYGISDQIIRMGEDNEARKRNDSKEEQ